MEGGIINVAGKCSTTAVINITGGLINICTVGNSSTQPSFEMPTGTFNMSGGIIRLVKLNSSAVATRWDYSCSAANRNFIGGKLVLGDPVNTTAVGGQAQYYVSGFIPTVELSEGIPSLSIRTKADIHAYGDVNIPSNGSMVVGSMFFNIYDATLNNNGSVFVTASSTGGLVFTGTGAGVYYKGTGAAGTLTSGLTAVFVNHPVGLTIDAGTTNNLFIAGFSLQRGSVFNSNKITIRNGGFTTPGIAIGSATGTVLPGNFDVPPVFNSGTGLVTLQYLGPTFTRGFGNEMPPSRALDNLLINSAGSVLTMSGGNLQVAGTLALTNGNIDMNGDTLTIGTSATSTGTLTATSATAVLYNGKLRRWLPNNSSTARTFPVGISTTRRNVSIAFTSLPTTGGTITAEWVAAAGGANGLPLTEGALPVNSILAAGYWRINAGDGLTGGAYTATLTASAVTGITDFTKTVMVKRTNNASAWELNGTHVTTTGTNSSPVLSRTAMSGFSEFGIGLPDLSFPLTTSWTGSIDTDWFNAANWSNGVPGPPTAVTIPAAMPRYPTISSNTSVKSLSVEPGASVTVAMGVNVIVLN
jgi:formylmethanofuran dehydrogenase subunit C